MAWSRCWEQRGRFARKLAKLLLVLANREAAMRLPTPEDVCPVSISTIRAARYQGRSVSAVDARVDSPTSSASATIILAREKLRRKGRQREDHPEIWPNVSGGLHSLSLTTRRRDVRDFGPSLEPPTRSERSSEIG